VNTVTFGSEGRAAGDSTDGAGFLRSLVDAGVDASGRSVLVLGGGGAARAVAYALGECGANVVVSARRAAAASEAATPAKGLAVPWDDRENAAASADIVVNATSVGMAGDAALPIPAEALATVHAVVDLVYEPRETPFLAAARARGVQAIGGIGMLLHQAARQIEIWSGEAAPIEAMRAAVSSR